MGYVYICTWTKGLSRESSNSQFEQQQQVGLARGDEYHRQIDPSLLHHCRRHEWIDESFRSETLSFSHHLRGVPQQANRVSSVKAFRALLVKQGAISDGAIGCLSALFVKEMLDDEVYGGRRGLAPATASLIYWIQYSTTTNFGRMHVRSVHIISLGVNQVHQRRACSR